MPIRHTKSLAIALTNGVTVAVDDIACIDRSTGKLALTGDSTTLLAIGYFMKAGTGDGTTKFVVELFEPIFIHYFESDVAPNNVTAAHIGDEVYFAAADIVSTSSASDTRSIAGLVLDVDPVDGIGLAIGAAVTGQAGADGLVGRVATKTALKALDARTDGQLVMIMADGSLWRFVVASTVVTDVAEELVLIPGTGTGRWLRADKFFIAKIPIAFGDADGKLIWTIPAGFVVRPTGLPFWQVTIGWTGGAASTIGVASTVSGYDTAGDILGGAAGDATAALGTAGIKPGTIGPKLDTPAEVQAFLMVEGDDLTYEEITSAFTAGAGFVCVPVAVMHAA